MERDSTPSIEELWTMVQDQQAAMQDEIAGLKTQLEQQRIEKLSLASRLTEVEGGRGTNEPRLSRAGLFKTAAVGVAALAGAGALSTQPASAAGTDGDVGLGVSNTTGSNSSSNGETFILAAGGMSGSAVFRADAYNAGANVRDIYGIQGQGSGMFSGVAGFGGPSNGDGIYGLGGGTTGAGVVGVAAGVSDPGSGLNAGMYGSGGTHDGVHGASTSGSGVVGESTSGYGVSAYSSSSVAVSGASGTSFDVAANGTGRIFLNPQLAAGGPTTGARSKGEQIVDSMGVPYVCTADGTPGTWQAIGNLRSFSGPHRVFGDGTVISYGTTTAAIDATAGSGVPAGAKSAYCAVQSTGQGVLTLFPDGATDPGIANWANTGASGQLALFYMLVPLSAAGKFKIHAYLTGQIYVDVWGYLL